jgi:tetraacyldisaccharide 4'-kinase
LNIAASPEGAAGRRPRGARSGPLGACSRWLTPLSWPYAALTGIRRRIVRARAVRLSVPVISIGNLSCGGTGKTPTVEFVCRELIARGRRPAILSRGYRGVRGSDGVPINDEFLVLAANLPGVPHFAGTDRVASGERAIADGADVLVLDDGFQHVRLARDLDLVLLDALHLPTDDRVLPAGFLREPLSALGDATLIAWTRTELAAEADVESAARILADRFPRIPQLRCATRPDVLQRIGGIESAPIGILRELPVLAFSGIGNPDAFAKQLEALGARIAVERRFADHHAYTRADLDTIAGTARRGDVAAVICTQKDAVKIAAPALVGCVSASEVPWYFLRISQTIVSGREDFERAVDRALSPS